jgi:hypothetical protein
LFGQLFGGRSELLLQVGQPRAEARLVHEWRVIQPELQLSERNYAQENIRLVVLDPMLKFGRHLLPLKHGQQVRVDQEAHLNGRSCRCGGGIGTGQFAKS